ncbi:MAG TPA: sterol desaturase family protein [Polyangiaceae bacterium]|jgi:sterol desaturase/sphingolipid hydroxylase (fatty acid hydroxylase superfamily)|nr:sterol desaturase family protein [Polyangiaceae bacterium]
MATTLSNLIPVIFVLCLVLERLFPGRPLPKVPFWLAKGFVFFVITGVLNTIIPAVLGPRLGALALVHSERLGVLGSAAAVLLGTEFFAYWTHRTMHRSEWLWRWTHQLHHSGERVDIAGAAYVHPLDTALNVLAGSLAAALVGAGADAAALSGFAMFLMAMFQHVNVKTPHVLGYVVQRPEGHSLHHERGLHAYNYGNLSLSDQLFGTFRNPRQFSELAGFWDGASAEMVAMFTGQSVVTPTERAVEGITTGINPVA